VKWFYITALVLVGLLVASPMFLLPAQKKDQYEGKIVRYGVYGAAVRSVDPATCGDTTSAGFQGDIYEGLYTYHFLKRPAHAWVIPQLAAEMPVVSQDGLTYTIKLKRGVKYHRNPCFGRDKDGKLRTRTMRAEDFVLAFKRVADYHINTGLSWAFATRIKGLTEFRDKTQTYRVGDFSRYDQKVEGVRAIDGLTLQFKLTEPFPQFKYVLAMAVYAPVPREAVDYWLGTKDDGKGGRRSISQDDRATEFREAAQVVGTGPYVLKTFERKARIVLVRNPDFREEFYPSEGEPGDEQAGLLADAGKPVPFIDVLHYDFVAETSSAWNLFLTRQRDSSGIAQDVFDTVVNPNKQLEERWKKRGIYLKSYWSPAVYWIVFNMEDEVIGASKSLRHGLCAAFDVESYLKVLFNNRGRRAVSILPSSFKGWAEAGPGPYYKLDLALAKRKIEQARKELAAKGLLEGGKIPELAIDLGGTDAETAKRAEFFRQQFAKIGVRMKVNLNDWPKLQEKVHNKQCQMYTMGWHADYPDAENFLQLFYSPNIDKQTNNSNYTNLEFDRLYEKVRLMPDSPERTKLYARMVNIISEDCPVLLLTEPQSYVLVYDWVKNYKPHPVGYGYARYLRIDTELRHKLGGKER
jgi:oligopeptide transport system substrate-binding protein